MGSRSERAETWTFLWWPDISTIMQVMFPSQWESAIANVPIPLPTIIFET